LDFYLQSLYWEHIEYRGNIGEQVRMHLRAIDVAALALNAALYAALGYLLSTVLPITTPGLGLVRFWPQVIIPAVFAVVFGPWVGGLGAGAGIFIADMFIHGNALLSLTAGVTSNFALFAIVGYLSHRKFDWKLSIVAFGIVTALLAYFSFSILSPPEYGFEYQLLASAITIGSYVFYTAVLILASEWRSYATGCMLGLLLGSTIIGIAVPLVIQIPLVPASLIYFLWTFVTEIPFLLVLGPPIIKAVNLAFPSLAPKLKEGEQRGTNL
jgi:uncharacterized membrane protein